MSPSATAQLTACVPLLSCAARLQCYRVASPHGRQLRAQWILQQRIVGAQRHEPYQAVWSRSFGSNCTTLCSPAVTCCRVAVLEGGLPAWKAAGGPVQPIVLNHELEIQRHMQPSLMTYVPLMFCVAGLLVLRVACLCGRQLVAQWIPQQQIVPSERRLP